MKTHLPHPPEKIKQIKELLAAGKSSREVARLAGVAPSTVRRHAATPTSPVTPATQSESVAFAEDSSGNATASAVVPGIVRTEQDAIRAAQVDLNVWFVESWQCTQWTTVTKDNDGNAHTHQQYRVALKLKRIVRKDIGKALDSVFDRMKSYAPKYPTIKYTTPHKTKESYLSVVSLADHHFGRMCWEPEVGTNYDLKTADTIYRNAIVDLLDETRGKAIAKFVLPLGNDLLHLDNSKNTTYNGTPQDVDGRYAKIIETCEMAVIWGVEQLAEVAPVEVVWVPGNHDPTTSFHVARTTAAWFRDHKGVKVDYSPNPRKYVHWNNTLLGLTHGNEEKIQSLPAIMATEKPKEWAASTCREWLLAHQHRSRQWQTQSVDSHEGTTIRVLRSSTPADRWHHAKGYIAGSQRAVEIYLYSRSSGYAGHAIAPVRL